MAGTVIDGQPVSPEERAFALSISDILYGDMLTDRLSRIMELAEGHERLRFVCVRNDSMDPSLFSAATTAASCTGLGLILESADPVNLREALASVPGRTPLLCITDSDRVGETAVLSAVTSCPMSVPGMDTESLMDNVEAAEGCGASELVLCPGYANMKGCLEINTDLIRLETEHSLPQASHPVMTRTWSGEYALSIASVSVMRHGALIVLDDLDRDGCDLLEALMDYF